MLKRLYYDIKNKLGGWEYIKLVPHSIEKQYWKKWKNKLLYGKTIFIEGKDYLYRIITVMPRYQGDTPRIYHRKKILEVI